jgi:amino acid adenylation domain-containing protein
MNESARTLSGAERQQILYGWNDTQREYPTDVCIHELFEARVTRTPKATAVLFGDERVSYEELNRRANQLAHYLREKGVKPEVRVGICAERGVELVVAVLAVLKAGGAYVPLDPGYPEERLQYMVRDSETAVVLTHRNTAALVRRVGNGITLVELDGDGDIWEGATETNPERTSVGLAPDHLAYVIYTSGSTGVPKGVMLQHRNTVNLICWAQQVFSPEVLSRTLFSTSLNFDLAVYECLVPLTSGGSIRVVSNALDLAGGAADVTLINTVPSVMKTLLEDRAVPATVEAVNVAGEPLKRELVERIFAGTEVKRICNLYGPTETATYSTWVEMKREEPFAAHIGRPIANTRVYILDEKMDLVGVGAVGEIYIGGAGVARGYLNHDELTAERFVPDPYTGQAGARMFKTGDVGRWLADGNLEFLGRNDDQVKIRGFRIDLGEIAVRLQEHPAVDEAVVLAQEDALGDKRLVAYYVTDPAYSGLCNERASGAKEGLLLELRRWLEAKLPGYMVPAVYVQRERMPLTANRKLDRKALLASDVDVYATQAYEAPHGETERALAGTWAELLHLERIGRRDNFFTLGGHSLMAARVVTRIRQGLRVPITVAELFAHPVLADLAHRLEGTERAELPPIVRVQRTQRLPLSFAQQRLWFLAQMEEVSKAYHLSLGLHLRGNLDPGALRRALARIVVRHEALRTTFVLIDGEPAQHIAKVEHAEFHLLEHDLRGHSAAKTELERLMAEEADTRFDLASGPLIRGRLIRESEDEYVLLITMHHIVSDEWSMGILRNELSTLYQALQQGKEDALPELAVQYADYAVWERQWLDEKVLRQQAEYWKGVLHGAPALIEMHTDHARPARQDYRGATEELVLEQGLTAKLKNLSRRHGATLYMTLLAGWAALLSRLSGQADVVIGTPVSNRERSETEGLIGFFVNTLALRVAVSGAVKVKELLERVKEVALAGQQNRNLPFEHVVDLVRPERSLAHNPLFQVAFAWQNTPEGTFMVPGIAAKPLPSELSRTAKFDLTLTLQEANGTIAGKLEYATSLFERATIRRYGEYFCRLLERMVTEESQVVARLCILSEREREQVLRQWNHAEVECPAEMCIHGLFEQQVEKTPEAVAVEFEGHKLTYRELNRRANQLAHYLRALGVKPETRVAICADHSLEMIVGLLAVLKAGGAYVPLDPAYPRERLQFMLEDSDPVALLTQSQVKARLGSLAATLPALDLTNDFIWNLQPEGNPEPAGVGWRSRHLAYVIYTSGSTGQPKGVLVEHANVVRLFTATHAWFQFNENDVWTLFHSYAFDFSVWEIWGALLYGGRLIVVGRDTARSAEDFYRLVCRNRVTILNQTPSAFGQFMMAQRNSQEEHRLRRVIFGGEALDLAILRPWYQRNPSGQTQLVNMYGITETTVHVTYRRLERGESEKAGRSPIGSGIPDMRTYILDAEREPVPVGAAGEMYLGGAGVARGYLHRPELTAERFLPDPYTGKPGARMYRSGDLGRWLPDGTIEFLGRNDDQVKIRGYRIELGEIVVRLLEHEAVEEAVVAAREDAPGEKRLVAYFTPSPLHPFPDRESLLSDLRSFLCERLPEYMVPAAYVVMESLPLTANGKLDRNALPAPEADAYIARRYEAPQGDLETALAVVWAEVLKLEQVGRYDNFFELGGQSLLALRVLFRVNDYLQMNLSVRTLLEDPVLMEFAQKLRSISGRPIDELEKVAKTWLRVHSMTSEDLRAALAAH